MKTRWVLLVVAGVLLAGSPGFAQVQDDGLQVEDTQLEEPVDPLGPPANGTLRVQVPCEPGDVGEAWVYASSVEAFDTANLTVQSVTVSMVEACPPEGGSFLVDLPVLVEVTMQAPAFRVLEAEVTVEVQKNRTQGVGQTLGPAQGLFKFFPDYVSRVTIEPLNTSASGGPQEALSFPIHVASQSNGPTRFEFQLADPRTVPEGFQPIVPAPIVLHGPGGDNREHQLTFEVYTPPESSLLETGGAIDVRVETFYAPNTAIQGESEQMTFQVSSQGIQAGSDKVIAFFTLGLVGASVLYHRYRL